EFDGLAEAFNQMGSALQGSQQLRDRLLGDVAHELRTPVATITGYLEALEDGIAELDPATVAILRAQGERLTRLASDLAAVARAQDPLAGLSLEVVSAASVLDEAARSAGPGFAAKSVALEVDADAAVRVRVDRPRFAQVLANLLENALRHTPAGGVVRLTAALVEGSAGGAGGAVEGGVDGGAGDRADGEAGDGTDGQADGGADDGRDGASASRVDGERHLADGRAALEDGGTDGAADLADGGAVDAGGGGPGGVVRIIVADSGDGIGQEHLANVFERFYRVDQARDRAHGGSGIGLAIAKALTEAHGGRITAASDGPDRGATFTLDLPAVEP
ncbi:MAG: hypothetical protein LBK95_07635, partial [Bifidobacteriaceae bacterium]|nr:hypothetical protein [Bifidobacteriaceae bacterium]